MTHNLFEYDKSYNCIVAGIDEAGRGPLAGPVVCACCIMPLQDDKMIDGINDSKKISEKKREILFEKIKETAIAYCIAVIDEKVIDDVNILNATKIGMIQSLNGLSVKPNLVLIDAVKLDCDYEIKPIIKGDATSYNIASASILAKVTRDKIMEKYDEEYPEYGFSKHKGYGTKVHIEAIKNIGPCSIHRKTFIKNFVGDIHEY